MMNTKTEIRKMDPHFHYISFWKWLFISSKKHKNTCLKCGAEMEIRHRSIEKFIYIFSAYMLSTLIWNTAWSLTAKIAGAIILLIALSGLYYLYVLVKVNIIYSHNRKKDLISKNEDIESSFGNLQKDDIRKMVRHYKQAPARSRGTLRLRRFEKLHKRDE